MSDDQTYYTMDYEINDLDITLLIILLLLYHYCFAMSNDQKNHFPQSGRSSVKNHLVYLYPIIYV